MWIPLWGALPFVALLASIALAPLLPRIRDHWGNVRVQLGVALALGVPVGLWMAARGEPGAVVHALVEYAQFITLLLSLYVVSGGIMVEGDIRATPRNNVVFLAIGGVVASLVGTTGASMLLVRPLLATNRQRRHRAHTMVFAIFIIANAGGLLTPLGDPPLFLGMLRGVPFLWTLGLITEWLLVNSLLLMVYWAIDRRLHSMEPVEALRADEGQVTPIRLRGAGQLLALGAIVAATALLPSINLDEILHGHAGWSAWIPMREIAMLSAAGLSLRVGDREARKANRFHWGPILEVASLFVGIFLTMVPALRLVAQYAPRIPISKVNLFVMTGSLSSVLDNAPTYSVFFELAKRGQGAPLIAGVPEGLLTAVSCGAVLCGAMTYIGNGPNFMVKSIAESEKVDMPTFGGYVFRWALPIYAPVMASVVLIFMTDSPIARAAGILIAVTMATVSITMGLRYRAPALVAPVQPAAEPQTLAQSEIALQVPPAQP